MSLNWDVFLKLPGADYDNFEALCRALIWRHYARYGAFGALAAQPGVEFHLQLQHDCSLGSSGRWYGWQCRWYELGSGSPIGGNRRKKIADAIQTTKKHLPQLTDWVLWTRHRLTKRDQEWFLAIETEMQLHLWSSSEVEDHLSGDAAILRETYLVN